MRRRQQIIAFALRFLNSNVDEAFEFDDLSIPRPTEAEMDRLIHDFEVLEQSPGTPSDQLRLLIQCADTFLVHCDPADVDFSKVQQLRAELVVLDESVPWDSPPAVAK